MKSCLVHVVLILTSISSVCWNAHASTCCPHCLSCDISGGNMQSICIPPMENNKQLNISIGQELKLSCRWTSIQGDKQYRWNISAPEGWRILLRVNNQRLFKFEAENINSSEDASFDSLEDYDFQSVDEFLSITNLVWVQAMVNEERPGFDETFRMFARTTKVKDVVDTQAECNISRTFSWTEKGYQGKARTNGSLIIMCNKELFHQDVFVSFFYESSVIIRNLPSNGIYQFMYVRPRFLINRTSTNQQLYVRCNVSQCDSFEIRFDVSGDLDLHLYNITVKSLIYNEASLQTTCMQESSQMSTSNPPTTSTYTTDEGNTSFTQENMTTWIYETVTMTTEGTAADSLPILLIATVSGVALFVLVFFVVLCICLRKRCHKNQSRGTDSAPPDDPASFNNEQHEYCEVRPSVKSPPYTTLSGVPDQSVGQKNYAFEVTGPAMVVADQESVHSDGKTAEVNAPTANNKVLSNGPVYTLVDMDKKALDREEKANNARNRGHAYASNVDKLDFIPLDEYETVTVSPPVSPGASARMRPDSYPLSEYETVSPPMSPVAMASELERPYDILQRGLDLSRQTATSSTVDKKAKEEADHDDASNVYNEIPTPDVALKESEDGSEAYQHLQRPLSKRPKAGAPLPGIPDEGYGRLDLEGSGYSYQTDPDIDQAQDSQGPKTTQVDPLYAIPEKPAKANVPDDDDPEYDLSDAFM